MTFLMPLFLSSKLGRRFGALSFWKKALILGGASMVAKRAQRMKKRSAAAVEADQRDADPFRTPL